VNKKVRGRTSGDIGGIGKDARSHQRQHLQLIPHDDKGHNYNWHKYNLQQEQDCRFHSSDRSVHAAAGPSSNGNRAVKQQRHLRTAPARTSPLLLDHVHMHVGLVHRAAETGECNAKSAA